MIMTVTGARGRPAKSVALIKETVFSTTFDILESKGVAALSIDEIARQSQLAKKTIYKHFDSKDSLIKEMIVAWTSTKVIAELPSPASKEEVITGLRHFFITLATRVLSRESVAIYRFLQNDVANKSELLAVYRTGGIDNATLILDQWLEDARSGGMVNAAWPLNGATYLQSLIITPLLRDISLGIKHSPSEAESGLLVDQILADFRPLLI